MGRYFLGVDIGATKSHALLADETGQAVGFGQAGCGKRQGDDYTRVEITLADITSQALRMAGISRDHIAGAGFGISDYDWPSQRAPHLRAIGTLGLHAPVGLVNDALLGVLAGSPEGWGISVVAGTGCNCWGWDENRRAGRVTGFGTLFGEGAGAYEVVMRAIQVIAKAWYRGGPPTRLTEAFIELVGAHDDDDLIEGLTLGHYHLQASAAPLVFRVAEQGDAVAQDVIRWAGSELGQMALAVCRQLDFEARAFDLVMAGSLFKGGAMLINALRDTVHAAAPGARLINLNAPPVIGGVVLGMEQAGLDRLHIKQARETLLASLSAVMTV